MTHHNDTDEHHILRAPTFRSVARKSEGETIIAGNAFGGFFDGRVHVWDAAAREWLLPRIVALSESKVAADLLRALMVRMLAPDPSKRPTFPELLEELT